MGNHSSKRAKTQEIILSAVHTTQIAGTRTLPHYRKTEDVHLQAVKFETQAISMVIDIFMGSIQ
jgi:hypothetical protein